ncbi:MAG: HepT-like ribonuclease domain-containing protein [Thermomicrobiales bacterium]
MQQRTRESLADAISACDYIRQTIEGLSAEDYVRNEDVRSIVERKLIVIGEAFVRIRQRDPEPLP